MKEQNARLAYSITLTNAVRVLSDKQGRPLYVTSKDDGFPATLQFGVSHYYVKLLNTLNGIISDLESTGIILSWASNEHMLAVTKGKRRARELRICKLNRREEMEPNDGVVILSVQVLAFGMTLASFTFICELVVLGCGTLVMKLRRIVDLKNTVKLWKEYEFYP